MTKIDWPYSLKQFFICAFHTVVISYAVKLQWLTFIKFDQPIILFFHWSDASDSMSEVHSNGTLDYPLYFSPNIPADRQVIGLQSTSQSFHQRMQDNVTLTPLSISKGKITSLRVESKNVRYEGRTTSDDDIVYACLRMQVYDFFVILA